MEILYIRVAKLDELNEIYEKRMMCTYNEYDFDVIHTTVYSVRIWTSSPKIAEKLNLEKTDKCEREKTINKNDTEIYIKKTTLYKKEKELKLREKDSAISF